jgi:hypothetical protein
MGVWLADYIRGEWANIMKAPFLLGAVLIIGLILGWLASSTFYSQDLQTLRDRISTMENTPAVTAPAPTPVTNTSAAPLPLTAASPTPAVVSPFAGGEPAPLYALVDKLGWPENKAQTKLKEIWGAHYIGGTVPLDGYVYYNTVFDHVTLEYQGNLPSGGWVNSRFTQGGFDSTNPAIKTAVIIMQSLGINPATACGIVQAPPITLPND